MRAVILTAGGIEHTYVANALLALNRMTPRWVFETGKALLTKLPTYQVRWDSQVKHRVIETLRGDADQFVTFCGKDPGFWKYE
jgi:hypothetical protein